MRGARFLMVMTLVLAACATDSEETTTTADADGTTTVSVDTTTTIEPSTTTTTTEATTTSTEAAAGGGDEACLIGDWELNSEAFMESLSEAFSEEAGTDLTIEFVGGSYIVSLSESGLFTGDRDAWAFQMSMQEGAFRITIDGLDTGSWEADGSTLAINDYESAAILNAQAVVDGELVDLPQGTVPMTDSSAVTPSSTYECSGDTLTVTAGEDFASEFTRLDG